MPRNSVPPSGPLDAPIVVLGEAPTEDDQRAGEPFAGAPGRLLFDTILSRAPIRRKECLVLHTHWTVPPGRKWETIPDGELGVWDTQTLETLTAHPRACILAVGGRALDFLLHRTARVEKSARSEIVHWRGSLLPLGLPFSTTALPMIHPSAVLRSGGYDEPDGDEDASARKGLHFQAMCAHDAKRARRLVDEPESMVNPERVIHHPGNASWEALMGYVSQVFEEATPLAFDLETYAHTVTCIGVAWSTTEAVVVPLAESPLTVDWTLGQRAALVDRLAELLDNPNPKIAQHGDYDVQHLARMGMPVRNFWLDTAVAHSILYPEVPHDLGTLTSLYTLQPYFKQMRKTASKEIEESSMGDDALLWRYNGLDCVVTWEVGMKLAQEVEAKRGR